MAITIVRLGSKRGRSEGLRVGTVRHLPRGVPKSEYAKRNYFDVWLPNVAPSAPLVKQVQAGQIPWTTFERRYRAEMKRPDAAHLLDLLVALSRDANFSVGCYCEDEQRCHRSVLRKLLEERGADVR